jgi:putative ABC transport system permease protein
VGGPQNNISGYTVGIDQDYISSFNLKIAAGRSFDREHTNEGKSIIMNQAMAGALDFNNPQTAIGEKVIQGRDTFEVVGVLEDYHQMSLKEAVSPLVYRYTPHFAQFFAFKVDSWGSRSNIHVTAHGIDGARFMTTRKSCLV